MPTRVASRAHHLVTVASLALWLAAAGCAVHASEPGARAAPGAAAALAVRTPPVPPPPPGRLHALLLNGGGRKEINYQSHLHHVRRVYEILRDAGVGPEQVVIFSADGADPGTDLATREQDTERGFWLLPSWTQNALRAPITYVDSTVDGVTLRPATQEALRAWFAEAGKVLTAGDTLLFYVTDHGEENEDDRTDNTISLWHETLSVTELRELLAGLDPGVRVVMLMSQCFSGSFAHVIRPDADAAPAGNVCGYFSATADRRAYGCYPENRGKDGIGHSFHFLEALAVLDRFPVAERSVLITDRTPDIPNSTLDAYAAARLGKAAEAEGRELTPLVDQLLAEAWKDRGAWEPEIRLLDRIGASFGTFSPRTLGELDEQARVLPEFSSRLATYADRWNQAFDALKIEVLREFVRERPAWKTRLEGPKLRALDAAGRLATLKDLLAELVPFAASDPERHARLKVLKRKAADASAASYRAEVRLGAVLRLRTFLTTLAGRVYFEGEPPAGVGTRATPEERAAFERLAACEDLSLGKTPSGVLPAALTDAEPFPPLAEERRLVEELMPAYMGIYFRPLAEIQQKRWSTKEGAVAIQTVNEGSPAEAAGLRVGDVILGPPGAHFVEPTQVREWTMRSEIGVDYRLDVLRDGQPVDIVLRPGPYPLELPKLPGPPKVGDVAPTMDVQVVRGEDRLAKDRPDFLYFWATWCVICKHALPEIMAFAEERGLDLIAITDEDPELVKRFVAEQRGPFPEIVAIDPHRVTFQGYGVSGTPSFVLVDRDGVVQLYQSGYSVEGGLHVDGWAWQGKKRAAVKPSPAPEKKAERGRR